MNFIKKNYGLLLFVMAACIVMFLGYELKNYKTTVVALKESILVIKKENKELTDVIAKKIKSDQATIVVVEDTKKEEKKVLTNKTEAAQYVEAKVAEIEKKYAEKEKTNQNAQLKATEISLERAKGMWLAYCLQEPAVPVCK